MQQMSPEALQAARDRQEAQTNLYREQAGKFHQDTIEKQRQAQLEKSLQNLIGGGQGRPQQQPQQGQPQQIPQPGQPGFGVIARPEQQLTESLMSARGPQGQSEQIAQVSESGDGQQEIGETVVINEGNPNFRKIDDIYNKHPEYRKLLESKGYKAKTLTKADPVSGQVFETTHYPSGRVTTQVVKAGMTEGEREFEKKIASSNAKIYSDANDAVMVNQPNMDSLKYIQNKINSSPNAKNVVGPMNSWMTYGLGDKADRDLLGQLTSTSGKILLDAATKIKGAFTGRDQKMIKGIKPNMSDPFDIYMGKLKSMIAMGELVDKRNGLIAKYIRSGKFSPAEAIAKARRETESSLFGKKDSSPKEDFKLILKSKSFGSQQEFKNWLSNLSPEKRDVVRRSILKGK
jgi:hypothetical protein